MLGECVGYLCSRYGGGGGRGGIIFLLGMRPRGHPKEVIFVFVSC